MQKIIYVTDGNLDGVNRYLEDNWKVVNIVCCNENVSAWAYGYAGGETYNYNHDKGSFKGGSKAYVVIEK